MLELIMDIDWKTVIEGALSNLIPTAVAGLFAYFFLNQMTKQIRISHRMKSYGFKGVETMKKQTIRDIERMCQDVDRLDMIYVSGRGFFVNNEIPLKKALERGMKIRFLCATPGGSFVEDIEHLEIDKKIREATSSISEEIDEVCSLYEDYIKSGKMKIRFYSTEYRLPFILAHSKENKMTRAWLTITLPPYKAVNNFVLSGEKKYDVFDEENDSSASDLNFIQMMEEHFDYVWNRASESL